MSIATVSFDDAEYIGDENDGVYVQAAEGPDGWYVSTVVDCNSASFTEPLVTDDGPYSSEADALAAGRNGAKDWCLDNQIQYEDEDGEQHYTVRWVIQVSARTPEDAAHTAAAMMRDPDTTATIYEVAPEAHEDDPNYTWASFDVPKPAAEKGSK
jgi:hypothetical protein